MGVRLIWYGCPPASMGVWTPTVEYNSPPMTLTTSFDISRALKVKVKSRDLS